MKRKRELLILPDYQMHTYQDLDNLVKLLSENFTVHVIDYPTYYAMDRNRSLEIVANYIHDCVTLRLKGKFHLLGLFWGARLAKVYAEKFPQDLIDVSYISKDEQHLENSLAIEHNKVSEIFRLDLQIKTPMRQLFKPALI